LPAGSACHRPGRPASDRDSAIHVDLHVSGSCRCRCPTSTATTAEKAAASTAVAARVRRLENIVLEDHRFTGTNDHVLRVVAPRIGDLEPLIEDLNGLGKPATSIVLSSPMPWAAVRRPGPTGT
jgi:hypothetical protein